MSPVAVDVRSSISSSQSKASSLQNSDSVTHTYPSSPFNFASLSSGFADAGQCGPDPYCESFPRSGSVAAGRSRPRLVKVRKQLGGRSRTSSSELGSGFNPFCSVNDGNSASSGGNGNVGFVIEANQSGSDEKNLENGERQSGENMGKLSSDENGKCNIGNGTESMKIGNVGFVFGARENAPESNVFWENRRSAGMAKKMVRDDRGNKEPESEPKCESFSGMGSVFGCDGNDLASNSNADKRECRNFAKKPGCDDSGEIKFENVAESGKHGGRAFALKTYRVVDLDSANLNSEKEESTKSVKKPECGTTVETQTDAASRGYDAMSFLFGSHSSGDSSKSTSNLQNGEFGENFGQSGCYGSTNGKEPELKKNNESGFVFGASWSDSAANSCEEKSESSENLGKPVSNVRRKMKVGRQRGFQKVKGNTNVDYSLDKDNDIRAFIYGSSSKTASTSSGMESNSEILRNCSGNAKIKIKNFHSDVSGKCTCIFDSSSDEIASASSAASVHNLPEEMKKLNIDDSVNVEGAEKSKEPSNNANRSSETRGDNSKGGSVHVKMTSGGNSDTIGQCHFVFGNAGNVADASGIPISEPFRTGLGENVDVGRCPQFQAASAPSSFASVGLEFQPSVSKADFVGGVKGKDKKSTWSPDGLGIPYADFIASVCDPSSLKENLFPELNKKSECAVKNSTIKGKRLRKTKGKLKKSLGKQWPVSDQVPKESSLKENPDSPGCYSPMDFSPYQETNVSDQDSGKASTHQDRNGPPCASGVTVPADLKGDDLAKPGEGLDSNGGGHKFKELKEEKLGCHEEIFFNHNCSSISGVEFAYCNSKMEQVCSSNGAAGMASAGARVYFNSDTEKQEKNSKMQFHVSSGLEDMKESGFIFSATSAVQGSLSATKRRHKRKSRIKFGQECFVINPSPNIKFGSSSAQSSPFSSTPSLSDAANKSEAGEQFKQGYNSSPSGTYETCEKWRLRGNKAYKDKDLSKAEEFYTQGIISVPSNERSGCCLKPLVLCYSNRAVTRMCLGKMKEAIGDCMMAIALDPSFLKAQMRAANCHLVLGEVEDAIKYFNKCLESGAGVCLDRRIIIDAADGLQKAQKVAEWTEISAKLLEQKNPDAALSALESISEALSISLYSENLLEMKAEALHMLRRHEEVIQLCEQSLCFAQKNFISGNAVTDIDGSGSESCSPVRLWRWCLTSKSYFHLGRLEAALALLDKLILIKDKFQSRNLESSILLAVTIREILHHKNAGNEAFKSGKHAEAVEHYTAALSNNVESRPFAAICFCNRAAAHQALGQIADAIADCSLAIALDGSYAKAVSRRVTLHEMIRDYAQAATDLQRLISILKNQSDDKTKESCTPGRSPGSVKELRKAQLRLPVMQEEAKKGICLDFYLILGSKLSDTPSDIKKAYRKAALKHHPDKAGQFLARSDSGDEGRLWKEISQEVNKDADRLFKMIGEAYAVLSDPAKRSEYDLEEDMRKAIKRSNGSSTQTRPTDFHRRSDTPKYQYERNAYRRNGGENWKRYGNSSSRW